MASVHPEIGRGCVVPVKPQAPALSGRFCFRRATQVYPRPGDFENMQCGGLPPSFPCGFRSTGQFLLLSGKNRANMHGLKFDGAILKAWWKAKLEKPKTWEEFVQIEEIWELADETKRELWELINK